MQLSRFDLKKYGKVEVCKRVGDTFHIKITDGFNHSAMNTFELMKKIQDHIGENYNAIVKCVTDKNLFDYILKQSK